MQAKNKYRKEKTLENEESEECKGHYVLPRSACRALASLTGEYLRGGERLLSSLALKSLP